MAIDSSEQNKPADKAAHGYRNEVSWEHGKGRQPYENQRDAPSESPPGSPEWAEGDRGTHSGENLQQLEDVKRKP
ncbi:hypothetical protein JI739_10765 [Ramlibacter sp. AW1]|uniref:Uncharacterized protein n=1 Tax=Ramlibacter aurantiacus TaxID=2801330 RepID=A0A936ZNC6_9BURK|nr:hypothetical protein [Ramlibacter aurantiacus]MBL0420826.1 hypothetical protein [Ramlibacter aurantiacus]